jgi:hypothetical protein
MPEVARRNTVEVGEPVLRAGSKIETSDQVEQALKGRRPRPPRSRCSSAVLRREPAGLEPGMTVWIEN